MADLTIIRSRVSDKPGRKVLKICASWPTTATTGSLRVANGNVTNVSGVSTGLVAGGTAWCSDAHSNGVIAPTAATTGAPSLTVARSEAGSAAVYFFSVEYDSN